MKEQCIYTDGRETDKRPSTKEEPMSNYEREKKLNAQIKLQLTLMDVLNTKDCAKLPNRTLAQFLQLLTTLAVDIYEDQRVIFEDRYKEVEAKAYE